MQTAIQLNFGSVNTIDVDSIHIQCTLGVSKFNSHFWNRIKFKRAFTLRWYMYLSRFLDCYDFHIIMLLSMLGLQFIVVKHYNYCCWNMKRWWYSQFLLSYWWFTIIINSTYGTDAPSLLQMSTESAQTTCMYCYKFQTPADSMYCRQISISGSLSANIQEDLAVNWPYEQSGRVPKLLWLTRLDSVR